MAWIEKISVSKKNPKHFDLHLKDDEGEKVLSVSEESLVKFRLHKGKEISGLDVEEILYFEEINRALSRALKALARRMRTEKEIRDDLSAAGFSEGIVRETLSRLQEKGYIDDGQFAEAFVTEQMRGKDKGPEWIRMALKEKGVKDEIIRSALARYTPEEQLKKAKELCEKLAAKKKNLSVLQLKIHLKETLLRKGFERSVCDRAVAETDFTGLQLQEDEALEHAGEKAWFKYRSLPEKEREIKVKQYLYRKGFPLEKIEKFLQRKKEE
ncbi:MAG: RecX family transcriptional regulator [Bacillaceae bacterium]|jgi:regulatory protein